MKKRKSFDVALLRDDINRRLAESTCEPEVRYGMISVLESVLRATGNYHGFCYLDPVTKQPVCNVLAPDQSRRYYYSYR
jgi:hypothetical protein